MNDASESECSDQDDFLSFTWILDDQIAIGNFVAAQNLELLSREGIGSVVSLDGTLLGRRPEELGLKRIEAFTFADGPGNDSRLFRSAVDALIDCMNEAPPVLVHCHAGRSRSAVVVAGYLMLAHGLDAPQALSRIRQKREINVSSGLEHLLESL